MTDIHAGDLVVAIPIDACTIGHPGWHADFDNPDMTEKIYMVVWSGLSAYWKRPIISVAGRPGHFCAGCFTRQPPPEPLTERRVARVPEPVA